MRLSMMAVCILITGCASANVDANGGVDARRSDGPGADANIDGPPPIDAQVTQTISETTSNQNIASNSATCAAAPGENSWYRVFRPSDFGITGVFNVTQVNFGAQEAAQSPVVTI